MCHAPCVGSSSAMYASVILGAPLGGDMAATSLGGVGVCASSQDTVRLATYSIGAQNQNSFRGKLRQRFEVKFRNDLRDLLRTAGILCIQEISEGWVCFVAPETERATLWLDLFPESDSSMWHKDRGVVWLRLVVCQQGS